VPLKNWQPFRAPLAVATLIAACGTRPPKHAADASDNRSIVPDTVHTRLVTSVGARPTRVCATDLPRFEAYPATDALTGAAVWPSVTVGPDSLRSDVALSEAVSRGPNFAAHLAVVEWSCGSPCQQAAVIDLRTGHTAAAITTNLGTQYRLNSRLLVANPPRPDGCYDTGCAYCTAPEYYVLEADSLRRIR
jgi:hypothetical protein